MRKLGEINILHSLQLRQRYGPISVVVVRHDPAKRGRQNIVRLRISKLIDRRGSLRTFTLTLLNNQWTDKEIVRIDNEIRRGGLIGESFRRHGFTVGRNIVDAFNISIPQWMSDEFGVRSTKAYAQLVEFCIMKTAGVLDVYGTLLEIYSPDFIKHHRNTNAYRRTVIRPAIKVCVRAGMSNKEIWGTLGDKDHAQMNGNLLKKYNIALKLSQPMIKFLRMKFLKLARLNVKSWQNGAVASASGK